MSRHFITHILITAAVALPSYLSAQPVVRILEPFAQSATSAPTIALKGVAAAQSAIVNIYWTDHQGHTGSAAWTASAAGQSAPIEFSAAVPVRPGANRITVIAVDSGIGREGDRTCCEKLECDRAAATRKVLRRRI